MQKKTLSMAGVHTFSEVFTTPTPIAQFVGVFNIDGLLTSEGLSLAFFSG
jgi:hypothetical protein